MTDITPQTDLLASEADPFSVRLLPANGHPQDVAVVGVRGEIDLATAPLLRSVLLPVLEDLTGSVVVDLSEVAFMDSTGVHVLVEALQRLEPQGRRLSVVCNEAGPVHRVLGFVGLLDKLAVHRSCQSAIVGGGDLVGREPAGRRLAPASQG